MIGVTASDPPPQWTAPPACPDEQWLEARIAELTEGMEVPAYHGQVGEVDGQFVLELSVDRDDAQIERQLSDRDCSTLAETAALTVASLAVTPVQAAPADPQTPSAAEPKPIATLHERGIHPTQTPHDEPRTAAPRKPQIVALGLAGGIDLGSVAPVASTAALSLGIRWRAFALNALGTFTGPRQITREQASVGLYTGVGGIDLCYRWTKRRFGLLECGTIAVGALSARPHNLERTTTRMLLWTTMGLASRVQWAPHPAVSLFAEVRVAVPIIRPRLQFTDREGQLRAFYRPWPVTVSPLIGLEFPFWRGT